MAMTYMLACPSTELNLIRQEPVAGKASRLLFKVERTENLSKTGVLLRIQLRVCLLPHAESDEVTLMRSGTAAWQTARRECSGKRGREGVKSAWRSAPLNLRSMDRCFPSPVPSRWEEQNRSFAEY